MHISVNTFEGSSPHTRGALPSRELFSLAVRIIPAYAGSTAGRGSSIVAVGDHPRIRGEHLIDRAREKNVTGSSPHTRGARPGPGRGRGRGRIIPAYAGSTPGRSACRSTGWDHPRIRGEHPAGRPLHVSIAGSSPHTRGARPRPATVARRGRIIPAYAGSTTLARNAAGKAPDHPRIRGEHHRLGCAGDFGRGSSPHTRGARRRHGSGIRLERIIPAYAGSTRPTGPAIRPLPDHPRIRGEHERVRDVRGARAGSSPHTRGAPSNDSDYPERQWIIPAYAGSTPRCTNARSSRRDHPRIRGEHDPGCLRPGVSGGSSPHTRGAPGGFSEACSDARIIPAYAGSTALRYLGSTTRRDHPRIRGEH